MATPPQPETEMGFALKYDGPAVERGRMDARDLGPALISVADLLERASELIYGEQGKVRVDVEADFERGSFFIDMAILPEFAGYISHLTREDIQLILAVLGVSGGGGLVGLLRWLKGRKPDKVEPVDGGRVSITINDQSRTLNFHESKVYLDPRVRSSLEGMVAPLRKDGIDAVEFGPDHTLTERVEKEEASYFEAPARPEAVLSTDEITATVELIAPDFKPDNKWRLQHSGGAFWAKILDDGFLDRVRDRSEVFGAGDALRVRARVTTTRTEVEVKHSWEILEVLEHIPGGGDQISLLPTPRDPNGQ